MTDTFVKECENGNQNVCTDLAISYTSRTLSNLLPKHYLKVVLKTTAKKMMLLLVFTIAIGLIKKTKHNLRKIIKIYSDKCNMKNSNACESVGNMYESYEGCVGEKLENSL